MDFEDELGPYVQEAMKDQAFRRRYRRERAVDAFRYRLYRLGILRPCSHDRHAGTVYYLAGLRWFRHRKCWVQFEYER